MVSVEYLNRYETIVLWGYIPQLIDKYLEVINTTKCRIVDSNRKKTGRNYKGISIEAIDILETIEKSQTAVIILSLEHEKEIYSNVRRLGFAGDVYLDNMICEKSDNNVEDKNDVGAYTIERHTQLLIALLKKFNIKDIVVSPGICNMNLVCSLQSDLFFNLISCIDERSAGYMACGIAQTTGRPVALSCTGATASRNYMSALTEAYYSKLPVLAITSSRDSFMINNGIEQITDRHHPPKDTAVYSAEITEFNGIVERNYCELEINRALNKLFIHGGGPVHINLVTRFSKDFSTKTLPDCRMIRNIRYTDEFPKIEGKVALLLKPDKARDDHINELIQKFAEKYNVVIIGDNLSNYDNDNFVNIGLLQAQRNSNNFQFDILISVGELDRFLAVNSRTSWRISQDGNLEDTYLNLENNFDMSFEEFLMKYMSGEYGKADSTTYRDLNLCCQKLMNSIPELPFSNIWAAQYMIPQIPPNSICYMGIFSSLKNWNMFSFNKSIKCYSTVGGFGIDGTMSALIGAALAGEKDKLYFGVFGELSFYYDMNVLGNRMIGNNVRIVVFNNNGGNSLLCDNGLPTELSMEYVGAIGHYRTATDESVIKAYTQTLGFRYMCASNKAEYMNALPEFLNANSDQSIILELIYPAENDFKAVNLITHL